MSTQNHVYDNQYEGGADDKCCLCFPIDCGVKTLAIFMCINMFLLPLNGVYLITMDLISGVIMVACTLPFLLCGWLAF